jgi:hypothetical protein
LSWQEKGFHLNTILNKFNNVNQLFAAVKLAFYILVKHLKFLIAGINLQSIILIAAAFPLQQKKNMLLLFFIPLH